MKNYLATLLLLCLITSCEFGTQTPKETTEDLAEAIPKYIDYRVEVINKKSGPCAQDSQSAQCANFVVEYPVITGKVSSEVIEAINENITSDIFDYAFLSEKPETFESLIQEMSDEYDKVLEEFKDYSASWSMEITSDIIYQDSSFISVATTIYSYTGGAHPNAYQVYRSYDLQNGQSIELKDILSNGYEESLNQAAEIEFRMLKEIPPTESLKDKGYFFEKGSFALNDNFAIINKSLIFYFNPYEIAPYASGPTELELKLTDYVDLINENGVLHDLKN